LEKLGIKYLSIKKLGENDYVHYISSLGKTGPIHFEDFGTCYKSAKIRSRCFKDLEIDPNILRRLKLNKINGNKTSNNN